ncbi:MAG: AtpZ/AtpI family protein [Myxococcota bacterium]
MSNETPLERRMRRHRQAQEKGKAYRELMQAQVGAMEVGLSVVVGTLLGYWVDRNYETTPWGLFVGLLLGVITAGRTLYRISKQGLGESDDGDEKPPTGGAEGAPQPSEEEPRG